MSSVTHITPQSRLAFTDIKELGDYRELFFALINRDIRLRYKQTLIGIGWAIVQPVVTMIVFSFFFGKLAKIPSEGVPYPVFSYAGLLLWTFFSTAINNGSNSLVSNTALITKVYFPRIIIPLTATLTPLFDYLIAGFVLIALMLYYQIPLHIGLFSLPLVALLTWLLSAGVSFWLSSLNVKFRDVRYVLAFVLQLWIYATPVIYPASVADRFKFVLLLNPMTGLIEAHRALILSNPFPWHSFSVSVAISLIVLVTGYLFFRRTEKVFADVI